MRYPPADLTGSLGSLARTGWLAKQPVEFQARIAAAGHWVKLAKGQPVYCAGDPATAIFGLESGLLDVGILIGDDEEVLIHRAQPGFWIGEAALLSDTSYLVSVWSAAESRVFCVSAALIRTNLAAHPEDLECFFTLSISHTMLAVGALAEVLSLPTKARFARLLLRLAEPDGSVQATQEELGRMAGMSRAGFRRSCVSLINSGAVKIQYGGLRVVDFAALRNFAELA